MEEIGLPFNAGGATLGGITLFAIFAIYKGWLVPKPLMDRLLQGKDENIAILKETNAALIESAKPTQKVLETINDVAREDST